MSPTHMPVTPALLARFTPMPSRPWPKDLNTLSVTRLPASKWLDLMHVRPDGVRSYLCSTLLPAKMEVVKTVLTNPATPENN